MIIIFQMSLADKKKERYTKTNDDYCNKNINFLSFEITPTRVVISENHLN